MLCRVLVGKFDEAYAVSVVEDLSPIIVYRAVSVIANPNPHHSVSE